MIMSEYGHEIGIKVLHADPFQPNGEKISSSLIRRYIMQGEMEAANRALGICLFYKGKDRKRLSERS